MVKARQFMDKAGKTCAVLRAGSAFEVLPEPPAGVKLHQAARSCAEVAGITVAPDGTRLAHVNEHIRTWGAIWNKGKEVETDLGGDEGKSEEQR